MPLGSVLNIYLNWALPLQEQLEKIVANNAPYFRNVLSHGLYDQLLEAAPLEPGTDHDAFLRAKEHLQFNTKPIYHAYPLAVSATARRRPTRAPLRTWRSNLRSHANCRGDLHYPRRGAAVRYMRSVVDECRATLT